MYEYHGWITLAMTPGEVEQEEEKLQKISNQVSTMLEERKNLGHVACLKVVNGQDLIAIAGYSNHQPVESESPLSVFQFVAEQAPGSYGLLYIRDDEDIEGFANEFQIWRLTRGKLEKLKDQYLSPCIPVIEDP